MTSDQEAQPRSGSQHAGLLARLQSARDQLHHDLPIPRVDPPVVVRYRPLEQNEIEGLNADARKTADDDGDATTVLHARLLAKACVGIYMLDSKDRPVSIFDEAARVNPDKDKLPTFSSSDLIAAITPDAPDNVAVVRALYLTDGDVIAASGSVQVWSAQMTLPITRKQQEALDPEG